MPEPFLEQIAHDIAREFIRHQVERGDTVSDLVRSGAGRYWRDYCVTIGGARCRVHNRPHYGKIVHVTNISRIDCCYIYPIAQLIREIKEPPAPVQLEMFGVAI